ncbi:FkbM family methyltransferase [Shinella sp. G-2]|uniref:FkbM family methyltransferase n=1 Tax=Shinella sp. G-2 TaxID=3133141 RepID=UPI003D0325BF
MQDKIVVNGLSFQVLTGKNKAFWDGVKAGQWENETFDFFRDNIRPTTVVLDVGAWIGATALYAAQLGAKCVAFEPDPVAFEELKANTQENSGAAWADRLSIINAAITVDGAPLVLGSSSSGGDSMSSALLADADTSWTVASRRLEDVLREFSSPGDPLFIKIDIEGGEYSLLPAVASILARAGATFHISLHPRFLRKSLRRKFGSLPWPLRFLKVRREFVRQHRAVLAALPAGKTISIESAIPVWGLLPMAALTGKFPSEIRIVPR